MRFDTPAYFQRVIPGGYNPSTGDYDPDTIIEDKRYTSVTDAGADTLRLFYGAIKQGSLVVRLQSQYKKPFSRIRIGNQLYEVDFARPLQNTQVFVISEVQG